MDKLCAMNSHLNPDFTFETYIDVTGSRFAYAAAKAVSEAPGKTYNPLLISGRPGMGKTHLLHAIGHDIRSRHPDQKIVYLTAGQLKNLYIDAVSVNKTRSLELELEESDVLLLDNLDMFSELKMTQTFFTEIMIHRTLHGKQTVLASSNAVSELSLDNHLIALIRQGLLTDLQLPPAGEFFYEYLNRVGIKRTDAIAELVASHYDSTGEMVSEIQQVKAKHDLLNDEQPTDNQSQNAIVPSDLWDHVLAKIEQSISQPRFETWFESTKGTIVGSTLHIESPNSFVSDWLKESYFKLIRKVVDELTDNYLNIQFITSKEVTADSPNSSKRKERHEVTGNRGLVPMSRGQKVNADLFNEFTPEKIELIGGKICGGDVEAEKLLLLLLYNIGLERTLALLPPESKWAFE